MNATEYKLDRPNQIERGDTLKAIRYGPRLWRIRAESRREVEPWWFKDGVLHTYWPDGRREIEISFQTLLGDYTTKRAAMKAIAALEQK